MGGDLRVKPQTRADLALLKSLCVIKIPKTSLLPTSDGLCMRAGLSIMNEYLPILIMFGIATVFAGGFLLLSYILGPKKPTASKLSVYECGIEPTGTARERFSVKFYLVAILFILFDIEVVFFYPWALNYKEALEAGHGSYFLTVIGTFFTTLTLGLIFAWRKGALDWGTKRRQSGL